MAEVYKQMRGISCDRAVGVGANKVLSVPDAIAQVLIQHEREKEGVQQELLIAPQTGSAAVSPAQAPRAVPTVSDGAQPEAQADLEFGYDPGVTFIGTCPDCKSELHYMEGCMKCMACGYSECG
jgi:ribonucleoside-diphosphate reductase alpha chain